MKEILEESKIAENYDPDTLLAFRNVTKIFKSGPVRQFAVDNVDMSIKRGESVSVVGGSGSGKTTLGLMAVKLLQASRGKIFFDGEDIKHVKGRRLGKFRSETQMIFQDPYSSLNPYDSIFTTVSMPLVYGKTKHESGERGKLSRSELRGRVSDLLEKVGLSPGESFLDMYPKKLSGGQRQRVAIARSLIMNPKFIVADEPTSMLDVSISAQVLNLLRTLKKEFNFSMMYISHELATASYITDKMAVMNLGRIVEYGDPSDITKSPHHPYSNILIHSLPEFTGFPVTEGEAHIDYNVYNGGMKGCTFVHSCPFKTQRCEEERPELTEIEKGHYVACFHPL